MSNSVEKCVFDHLVIGARDLSMGRDWFAQLFESDIAMGGKHPDMSTHNLLSSVSQNSFLEVIAIDPEPPAPARARWFSLDSPETQKLLAIAPRLLTWVVGTSDLDESIDILRSVDINVGNPIALRRGNLRWRLSVPTDGALVENGVIPSFIEWPKGTHPASAMQSNGLSLQDLTLCHPDPKKIEHALRLIGADKLATVKGSSNDSPSLSATLNSPVGQRLVS